MELKMLPATESDFEFVYELYNHPAVNPFMGDDVMPKDEFRQIVFSEMLQRNHFWIFSDGANDIGMASVVIGRTRMQHVATIRGVAVHPNAQGKGYGRKMMQQVLEILVQNKAIKKITLGFEADNPKAGQLYEKLGFGVEGRFLKNFRRAGENVYIDHIMMSKWIGE